MKILIVPLLKRKVTPFITAARPRLIFELVVKLTKRGHKVFLLGTKNSFIPKVRIIPVIKKSLLELGPFENPFYAHTSFLTTQAKILEKIGEKFDLIHNHCYPEFLPLLIAKNIKTPILTTIHSQMTKELDQVLSLFNSQKNIFFVTISKKAKKLAKKTKIYKVIYNGIDTNFFKFSSKKEDYLLWIGRLSKAKNKKGDFLDPKGVKWAIKLARETGKKLLLSGNVEDIEFFNKEVRPYLSRKIQWVGKVLPEQPLSKKEVAKLMQRAKVFLMTVNWEEPFGLVMAEAQSCGTPVIGFKRGAVPELVKDKKTGFVVEPKDGIEGLKKALKRIDQIDPKDCRKHIEENFNLEKMVENYERTYKEIVKSL